jgi:hypothetical protein
MNHLARFGHQIIINFGGQNIEVVYCCSVKLVQITEGRVWLDRLTAAADGNHETDKSRSVVSLEVKIS